MSDLVYLDAPSGSDYLELAQVGTGAVYRKMIFRRGDDFVHPQDPTIKIPVTDAFISTIHENFERGYCDIVQFPICDDKNRHTEDPLRNGGQIIDLEEKPEGLYALVDARKPEVAQALRDKTLIGASAMVHLNYLDTKSGRAVGPTLLHVAGTNRPHITQLEGFEEVLAASAADNGDVPVAFSAATMTLDPEATTPEETPMNKAELLAALKALPEGERVDVDALLAENASLKVAAPTPPTIQVPTELSNTLQLSATDGNITLEDIARGVVELSHTLEDTKEKVATLQSENDALQLSAAEQEVDGYIKAGRLLPRQRDLAIKLSREDDRTDFEALVSDKPIVSLSETGVTIHDQPDSGDKAPVVDDYAKRMTEMRSTGRRARSNA